MANYQPKDLVVSELPPNWALFVDQVARGAEPAEAAESCGYAAPARTAALLMGHAAVRKALVLSVQARLEGEAGPLAVAVILEILKDPKALPGIKAKLALGVIDRIQPAKEDRPAGEKPLGQMTVTELAAEVERLRSIDPPAPQMRDVTPGQPTIQGT